MLDAVSVSVEAAEKLAKGAVKVSEAAEKVAVSSAETFGGMGAFKAETAGSMGELKMAKASGMGNLKTEKTEGMGELKNQSFGSTDNLTVYKQNMREVKKHFEKAQLYEREANTLERKIQRGIEPRSKMSEVSKLQAKAKAERAMVKKYERSAETALNRQRNVSFNGGLGADNAKHLRGAQMISDANSKRAEASALDAKARRLEASGQPGAGDLRIRAQSLRREADRLEREGRKLKNS